MPRTARKLSESGFYHVILRGNNRQTVFLDDSDREVFLNRLKLVKQTLPFEIHAFCLMDNHVHLLLRETTAPLSKVLQKALTSFVMWYNKKYERIGNLFQDRFKSEPIKTDAHLLCCLRYIHQNPLKAGMVKQIGDYNWSSHSLYAKGRENFITTSFILSVIGGVEGYTNFVIEDEIGEFIDFDRSVRISDIRLIQEIQSILDEENVTNIQDISVTRRNSLLRRIKEISGASVNQVSRLLNISYMTVKRA